MKTLKLVLVAVVIATLMFTGSSANAQRHRKSGGYYSTSTYKVGSTKYISGETYKTTGLPKVERSTTVKKDFLKSNGYSSTPLGSQVDHIIPLSKGGADATYNMQILTTEQHKIKTASERKK